MKIQPGIRIWLMTEVIYDEHGQARILRSFTKPSKGSTAKQEKKVVAPKQSTVKTEDVDLF